MTGRAERPKDDRLASQGLTRRDLLRQATLTGAAVAFAANQFIAEQQDDSQDTPAPTHRGLLSSQQNQVRNLLAPSGTYQVESLRRYLDVAARRLFLAGLHLWNFADFKTGQGTMRTAGMNFKGVFTRERRPKMAAHLLRSRWADVDAAK